MNQVQYTCGNCGKPTSRSDSRCPHCGVAFGGIHCKNCGYNGAASEFRNDICPKCCRNAYTGCKAPEGPKELTPRDNARIAGCVAVLGVVLIMVALLSGMAIGCKGVLAVMGAFFLIASIPLTMGIFRTKDDPVEETGSKPEPPQKPAPVLQTSSFAPCPFPQFPLTGWRDPITGGCFVPHPMSWNAGVRSAYEGLTGFIMSGEMNGRFFYAHFSREGTAWKAMIDDYLP